MNETAKWVLINIGAWLALFLFIFITKVLEDIRNMRWRREDAVMKAKAIAAFVTFKSQK